MKPFWNTLKNVKMYFPILIERLILFQSTIFEFQMIIGYSVFENLRNMFTDPHSEEVTVWNVSKTTFSMTFKIFFTEKSCQRWVNLNRHNTSVRFACRNI